MSPNPEQVSSRAGDNGSDTIGQEHEILHGAGKDTDTTTSDGAKDTARQDEQAPSAVDRSYKAVPMPEPGKGAELVGMPASAGHSAGLRAAEADQAQGKGAHDE